MAQEVTTMEKAPAIPKHLFIEDRHPRDLDRQEDGALKKSERETILQHLLDRDYRSLGRLDGYKMCHLSKMEEGVELIASDFRQAYDMALQDFQVEIDSLDIQLKPELEELMPDIYEKIRSRLDQLIMQKTDLMLQKDLAVTGEGYLEKPVKYYKAGFREGYDLYVQEKLMFKHVKTL